MTTLRCELCLQDFDVVKHVPKFLMCFHSFCLECLEKRQKTKTVINCPTCLEATNVNSQPLNEVLKTNFYLLDQMKDLSAPSTAAIGSSNEKFESGSYFWCSSCKVTFKKGTDGHPENHETYRLDSENGREIAEIHFKTLLVTCKSQWNSALGKYQEAGLGLKAAQTALQALEQQICIRQKKNDWQMEKLEKHLSEVVTHLSVPANHQQLTSEKLHNLFQLYNKLIVDSKAKVVKTGNKLAAFSALRNAVVSMDIKTSKGEKLATPLFDSALLNLPSESASSYESHLLTTLAFLVLCDNQNKHRTKAVQSTDRSESVKPKKKKDITESERKKTSEAKPEAEPSKPKNQPAVTTNKGERNLVLGAKTDKFVGKHGVNHPGEKTVRNSHQNVRPPKQVDSVSRNSARKDGPHGNTCHTPSIPNQPLFNKKAFFVLAVNGKEYGSVVIELRPDVAPVMCQRFVANCMAKEVNSYQGTIIYDAKPKTYIMGGRVPGPETLYMADSSPLKKTRGAVFFRLKRDFVRSQCSIVATDFCIRLGEDKIEHSRTSTVFGFVCDGLAVCDAISHMDCNKEHVAVASVGIVG